jgi:hypothetical protein
MGEKMKRSEMITLLQKSYFKHQSDYLFDTDRDMWSAILLDIEQAGMLPPENPQYNEVLKMAGESNEWEQE